ncbi:unnamed protein product [Ectocarpus sp. 4 AP-2014]
MRAAAVQWDLSSMGPEELLSEGTIFFLAKVLAAASVVAFGPALVLEYVPTSKVDVRDVSSAGSQAGRIQRLLLAFAGGGLMAEAALHLLPHLFLPKHDHDDNGHESLANACTLIAVGFLAAFAIDRFVGVRQQRQQGAAAAPAEGKEEAAAGTQEEATAVAQEEAAAVTAAAHAAATAAVLSDSGEAVTAGETTDANSEGQQEDDEQQQRKQGGGGGGEEPEDPPRELLEYSSASVEDEGSAAGAMLASAHMSQTPEKRASTASSESCRPGAPEVVELFPVVAPSSDSAVAAPSSPELTLYGNPTDAAIGQEGPPADAALSKGHAVLVRGGGGDAACSKGDHHHDHHDHGPADAGAYVTLAVDFLHNLIDGIGIGAAYAVGGDAVGHATAALKLVHEVQHEIGDVATLVQCGMSKHHAIHVQHTTAAGVFLGVAISLGAGAFPEGLLAACLALSAGATFHLASGPVLGPVLAIPADVGGPVQGLLEVAALAAGAAGVVAIGLAEGWAGIGH